MAATDRQAARPALGGAVEDVFLSVVIPAHNEERRLATTLERVRDHLDAQPHTIEVLVVDNASRDGTRRIAESVAARDRRFRVLYEPIRGKGAAIRRGMLAARGSYRFLCDADLSMPIDDVRSFLPPELEDVDVVVGSREARGAVRYDEPSRRHVLGRVFNGLVRRMLVPDIQDTQCGFKCFRDEAAEAIFGRVTCDGFAFDVESLVLARRLGYRVVEIPVRWTYDGDSRVRVVRDSVSMLRDVLAIWLRLRLGAYDRRP